MSEPSPESAKTIRLAEHRVFSNSFKPLYNDGMSLVEQTAEYLDGDGRARRSTCLVSRRRFTRPNPCASPHG